MNIMRSLCWTLATVVTVCSMSSCSLEHLTKFTARFQKPAGAPLQHGVKYEVRSALAAGVPFKPTQMKRYYFVIDQSGPSNVVARPPLAIAKKAFVMARKVAVMDRPMRVPTPFRPPSGKHMTVRTTAYCHDENDHIVYGKLTAVGTRLKYGAVRSAAADWSRYPVGTRFRIADQPDVVYEVDDYGSALVGTGTIDLYHPTQSAMNKWGVRHVDIEVLEWGSFEESMSIMSDRARWPHVRRMISDIQNRVSEVTAETVKAAPGTIVL